MTEIEHGTNAGRSAGCECDWCLAARRVYQRMRAASRDETRAKNEALLEQIREAYLAGDPMPKDAQPRVATSVVTATGLADSLDRLIAHLDHEDDRHIERLAVYARLRGAL